MNLYTERRQTIDAVLPPGFLDLHEKELQAPHPVTVQGEAYPQDDLFMIHLDVSTEIEMPCSICNKSTRVPLQNKNIIISIPLAEIPSAVYNVLDLIREEVVMLIPPFIECKKGACPQRKELDPFLKHEKKNFPFADLH